MFKFWLFCTDLVAKLNKTKQKLEVELQGLNYFGRATNCMIYYWISNIFSIKVNGVFVYFTIVQNLLVNTKSE